MYDTQAICPQLEFELQERIMNDLQQVPGAINNNNVKNNNFNTDNDDNNSINSINNGIKNGNSNE